jgi:hypothetical protein
MLRLRDRVRFIVVNAIVALLVEGVSATTSVAELSIKIEAVLPKSWSVVERKANELPHGHYWGQAYSGVRGEKIVLQGDRDVNAEWLDSNGEWHKDAVAKEVLQLYVMPPTYRESWLRFFVLHRPQPARLIVETKSFRVYAYATHRIVDKEKFEKLLKQIQAIGWPDAPHHKQLLSWDTWGADIARVLQGE